MDFTLKLSPFIIFVFVASVKSQEPYVTIDVTQSFAKVGENITVECSVENRGSAIIALAKQVRVDVDDVRTEQISSNDFLYPPYDQTGRHALRQVGAAGEYEFIYFHIYNVNKEDTGRYSCAVLNTEASASTLFEVYNPADSIEFENLKEDGILEFEEDQTQSVTCTITNTVPIPRTNIMIGDKDATWQFIKTSHININCPNEGNYKKDCLLHFTYDIDIHSAAYRTSYTDDGKRIRCEASVVESGLEPAFTEAMMTVYYKPKFECEPVTMAPLHGINQKISCIIQSNPGDLDTVVLTTFNNETTMNPGYSDQEYSLIEKVISEKEREVTLTIHQVNKKHFAKYILSAANNRGENSTTLILKHDGYTVESEVNSGPVIVINTILLVLVTFCWWSLNYNL